MLSSNFGKMVFLSMFFALVSFCMGQDTWKLGGDEGLVEEGQRSAFEQDVAKIKRLSSEGKSKLVEKELIELGEKYPELGGADFDNFVDAETAYAEGDLKTAAKEFNNFLENYPKSPLFEAGLRRYFQIGNAYLGGEKKTVLGFIKLRAYDEGVKIMNQVSDLAGDSPLAVRAAVSVAESYESRGKYEEAYFKWSETGSRWGGELAERSLLNMARMKHAEYQGPKYDESPLLSAESFYKAYMEKYPEKADRLEIGEKLELIKEQRAYKQLTIGKYYDKTGEDQAANFYYEMIIDKWPDTVAGEEARMLGGRKG